MKVMCIVGARPNFMKMAPIMRAMGRSSILAPILVHTGQHYDERMSKVFFDELEMPQPDVNLGIGAGSHAEQTARVMVAFEKLCLRERPGMVLVVGDVNSTLACGIVAAKLGLPLAHVEAGLRSRDRTMPEEINRIVTDALSDLLFTTSPDAGDNLRQEGIPQERIHFVGNVMVDTLLRHRDKAGDSAILAALGLARNGGSAPVADYAAMTLHRPSNVDDPGTLSSLLDAIEEIQKDLPVVFPIHPRTRQRIESFGLRGRVEAMKGLILTEPLGYIDFLALYSRSRLVLTDSGGLQEETTALGIPCLTLRENTERPVTIREGTNTLVGVDRQAIIATVRGILANGGKQGRVPKLWDGKAAGRIVAILESLGTGGNGGVIVSSIMRSAA